jgi:hypothetical protein
MKLQGQVLMQYHGMRLLTASAQGHDPGLARMTPSSGRPRSTIACRSSPSTRWGNRATDSPRQVARARPKRNLFDIGMIIGGGTAQIQKNIIAEATASGCRESPRQKVSSDP